MNRFDGVKRGAYDARDYKLVCTAPETFPTEFRLNLPFVKNQGNFPTCAAHAGSEIIEYFNYLQQGKQEEFSTDFLYGYRPEGYYQGDGMILRELCKTMVKHGDCLKQFCPTNSYYSDASATVSKSITKLLNTAYPNRISTYFSVSTVDEIKQALLSYGPVVCAMKWHRHAYLDKDFCYNKGDLSSYGGHAVVIVGWNDFGFIVQNSWGDDWGDKGFFYITYDDIDIIYDAYGITDTIINDDIDKSGEKGFITVIKTILSFIYRLLNK